MLAYPGVEILNGLPRREHDEVDRVWGEKELITWILRGTRRFQVRLMVARPVSGVTGQLCPDSGSIAHGQVGIRRCRRFLDSAYTGRIRGVELLNQAP